MRKLILKQPRPELSRSDLRDGLESKRNKHNGKTGRDGYNWDGSYDDILVDGLMEFLMAWRALGFGISKTDAVTAIRSAADWLDENVEDA